MHKLPFTTAQMDLELPFLYRAAHKKALLRASNFWTLDVVLPEIDIHKGIEFNV